GAVSYSTLINCLLMANSNSAAYECTLDNCTVVGNSGGGVASCTLNNCLIFYNPASGGANYDDHCTLNYCCTTPMPTNGVGNITNEPALAGPWRLSWNSPCRGAGNAAYTSGVDLDGEPWLHPPSIGCDEYYSGSITGAISV